MPSLLFIVFALQLTIHIINSVGAAAVNELVQNYPLDSPFT